MNCELETSDAKVRVERATSPFRRATCPPSFCPLLHTLLQFAGQVARQNRLVACSTQTKETPAPAPVAPVKSQEPLFTNRPKKSQLKLLAREIFFGHRRRRPQQGNVQGELALDQVKVMRNDLSETDLEVVPTRVPQPAPLFNETKVVPLHKQARDWVTLTLELLNPKKTVFYPSRGIASVAEQNQTPELIMQRR